MRAKTVTTEQGTKLEVMGDAIRFILTSEDTDGRMTMAQQRSLPGAGIPLHVHAKEDEIFQVLEGQVQFQVGDQTTIAESGTVVFAPKQLPHGFRVVGETPALIQITMMPGGLDKMMEEIVRLPAPLDPRKVEAICERYEIKFLHHPPIHSA
jgi:quercetin dioxygenase-like cupin family protein